MRKIIAKRLLESKLTLPHSYMAIEIEMDSLMATRAKFNKANSSKVSVNDLVIKAVAYALKTVMQRTHARKRAQRHTRARAHKQTHAHAHALVHAQQHALPFSFSRSHNLQHRLAY